MTGKINFLKKVIGYDSNKLPTKVLIIIFLLIIILFKNSIYAYNYFHKQTKSIIKLSDYQTLQQEWLATQSKMKRYDINVLSINDAPKILEYFDIKPITFYNEGKTPGYNECQSFCMNKWYFKNPPSGLLGVYFKFRLILLI